MSFLARRVAASEGAFFSQSSKQAIARLREKKENANPSSSSSSSKNVVEEASTNADVLPEILQHTIPKVPGQVPPSLPSSFSPSSSSLAASLSSSAVQTRSSHPSHNLDTTGLFAFLPNLPQASFGPRRWKPDGEEVKVFASTANEAKMQDMPTMDDARAKALVEGYAVIMKSFLIATALVVGGATVAAGVVTSKLQIRSIDDVRTKGQEYMQPRADAIRQRFEPWKHWVDQLSKDWNMAASRRDAVSAPFAEVLGVRQVTTKEVKEDR